MRSGPCLRRRQGPLRTVVSTGSLPLYLSRRRPDLQVQRAGRVRIRFRGSPRRRSLAHPHAHRLNLFLEARFRGLYCVRSTGRHPPSGSGGVPASGRPPGSGSWRLPARERHHHLRPRSLRARTRTDHRPHPDLFAAARRVLRRQRLCRDRRLDGDHRNGRRHHFHRFPRDQHIAAAPLAQPHRFRFEDQLRRHRGCLFDLLRRQRRRLGACRRPGSRGEHLCCRRHDVSRFHDHPSRTRVNGNRSAKNLRRQIQARRHAGLLAFGERVSRDGSDGDRRRHQWRCVCSGLYHFNEFPDDGRRDATDLWRGRARRLCLQTVCRRDDADVFHLLWRQRR